MQAPPLIAITPDIVEVSGVPRCAAAAAYAGAVSRAGGIPMIVTPQPQHLTAHLALFDGFVLTGGDDPRTEPFGEPTHPAARPVDPARQAYEMQLLRRLADERPGVPVLGVCLGMQMMALVAGGRLDQHLPDTTPTHADHWDADHPVEPVAGDLIRPAVVRSKHRQAVDDPGALRVTARSADGLIEAVDDPARPFYVGVQWHPERRDDDWVVPAMVDAASRRRA